MPSHLIFAPRHLAHAAIGRLTFRCGESRKGESEAIGPTTTDAGSLKRDGERALDISIYLSINQSVGYGAVMSYHMLRAIDRSFLAVVHIAIAHQVMDKFLLAMAESVRDTGYGPSSRQQIVYGIQGSYYDTRSELTSKFLSCGFSY